MQSILIAGVGGQGTLLASVILGRVAVSEDRDVKLSEVHGMSQRGGSVVSYVRIGDSKEQVFSPVIAEGGADILLAFEELEALRWLHYVNRKTGRVFVNRQNVLPMPVIMGKAAYPEDIEKRILEAFPDALFMDARDLAAEAGSEKAANTVMIGALARSTDIPQEAWLAAVRESVKPAYREINEKAFLEGFAQSERSAS